MSRARLATHPEIINAACDAKDVELLIIIVSTIIVSYARVKHPQYTVSDVSAIILSLDNRERAKQPYVA